MVRPSLIISAKVNNARTKDTNWRKKPTRTDHKGKLSPNARRKLKNAMRWLIACSSDKKGFNKVTKKWESYRISLITLTFKSNMQDDAKARMLCTMWLEMARYRWGLERYVWKAEPQERGAIHFHVAVGIYIPHTEICYTWNRLLAKHGLEQTNANSTDVHACFGVRNLEAYLTEYLMNEDKHQGRRAIVGRLWGCDHKLSQAGKLYCYLDDEDAAALRFEYAATSLQAKMNNPPKFLDFIEVYCVDENFWRGEAEHELKKLYMEELRLLKPSVKQKQLFPIP